MVYILILSIDIFYDSVYHCSCKQKQTKRVGDGVNG